MSRGFFGGGGGKKSGSSRSKNQGMFGKIASFKRNQSLRDRAQEKASNKVRNQKEMLEDLLDKKMSEPRKNPGFTMPGAVPYEKKEVSKNELKAMEILKQKKSKKKMSFRDTQVRIIPRAYHEGRLMQNGKILDKHGHVILQVNPNTGVITNNLGLKVGKYNPNSLSNRYVIDRLIHKFSRHNVKFNPFVHPDPHQHK